MNEGGDKRESPLRFTATYVLVFGYRSNFCEFQYEIIVELRLHKWKLYSYTLALFPPVKLTAVTVVTLVVTLCCLGSARDELGLFSHFNFSLKFVHCSDTFSTVNVQYVSKKMEACMFVWGYLNYRKPRVSQLLKNM